MNRDLIDEYQPWHDDRDIQPEVCSIHGCEMDGEYCPECEAEKEADLPSFNDVATGNAHGATWNRY